MTETVLHVPTLYSTLGGDPDFCELIELFVDEMPQRIAKLEQFFTTGNWDELCRIAHQLKGAFGSYGFHQITPFAGRLEAALKDQQPATEIRESFEELIQVCGKIRAGQPQ